MLSQFNTCYSPCHWQAAKRILRTSDVKHAGWGNCGVDRRSYSGYTFTQIKCCYFLVIPKAKDCSTLFNGDWIYQHLRKRKGRYIPGHVLQWIGNQGSNMYQDLQRQSICGKLAHNSRTKHIDIRAHFIRQAIQDHRLKMEYLPTEYTIADVLTKALSTFKHENCVIG